MSASAPMATDNNLRLLEEAFQTYRRAVLDDPHPEARRDSRRAFYTGAFALWHILQGLEDQAEGVEALAMQSLGIELQLFQHTLGTSLEGKL